MSVKSLKHFSIICIVLLVLPPMIGLIRPVKASQSLWFNHQGDYVDYGTAPLNFSTTTVCTAAGGHVKTEVELVVTVNQYDWDRQDTDTEFVLFRVAVYVKASADPGFQAQYPLNICIDLEKEGANLTHTLIHTWTEMRVNQNMPGLSQGYAVFQNTFLGSNPLQRLDWVAKPLAFALAEVSEPFNMLDFLVGWAQSFNAVQGTDYANANIGDLSAYSYWSNGLPDSEDPPFRTYCFNCFYWHLDRYVAPSSIYTLAIRAYVNLLNPAVIPCIITSPVKLNIMANGGSGCPFVFTWNGTQYVLDNNILPAAEISNGIDVEDYYRLEHSPVTINAGRHFSLYKLQICEFEYEHDYLDMIKLFKIDHSPNVNVAVSPYGEILTYQNPDPPVSAFDETGANVLSLVNSIDGSYYQGHNGSYVTLTFNRREILNGIKLVIRDDERPPLLKCPVNVQVLNATGCWNTVATFFTRTYWATDIINMTAYLPDPEGNLKVRLCFIANDKIDYIGIDTSPQASVQIRQATLVAAVHSTQGNVKNRLISNDQVYAEIMPGQQIYLEFLLPKNLNQESTFVFYSEGRYSRRS
jgi:hypothetical protein